MALVGKLREKLPGFRFHALLLAVFAALVLALLRLGPSFVNLVSFFRPLLLSTALFLAAVLVLSVISPPPAGTPADSAGVELMDYVAGRGPAEDFPEAGASGGDTDDAAGAVGGGQQRAAETRKSK